jgi:hypothetical protein
MKEINVINMKDTDHKTLPKTSILATAYSVRHLNKVAKTLVSQVI